MDDGTELIRLTQEQIGAAPFTPAEAATVARMALRSRIQDALYDVVVDHAMWIDGKGEGLEYSPEREKRIGDFLEEAADAAIAVVATPTAEGGTDGLHEWECPSCGATTRARMADSGDALRTAMERLSVELRGTAEVTGGKVNGYVFADKIEATLAERGQG